MNQNNTKIAVIMPVYNAEKFLSSALESLLNQSFQDIKIIRKLMNLRVKRINSSILDKS